MEQQEYFLKMNMLGQEAEKIEQQIQAIDQQIAEISAVKESIEAIENCKDGEGEILANLGKGIFAKADLREKQLFVNIGKEVIAKKTPKETIKIIDEQMKKLLEGKETFINRIEDLQESMQSLLLEVQKSKQKTHKHECKCAKGEKCESGEDCECEDECQCGHKH